MIVPSPVPAFRTMTIVCAHPDDETFGLGALVTAFVDAGSRVDLICLTAGEGSTLGAGDDLATRRSEELACAAEILGIADVALHHHPDGSLASVPVDELAREVATGARHAEALLTYDHGGITGHADHQHATDVAIAAGRHLDVPVLGWALTAHVAGELRAEFGAPFVGRDDRELDLAISVDRSRQRTAMACHDSQLQNNAVPHRRIELQGTLEHLRALHTPDTPSEELP
ncbi:MAG: PIG-L family deacetylase [Nitriliruptoraceae bacterium]